MRACRCRCAAAPAPSAPFVLEWLGLSGRWCLHLPATCSSQASTTPVPSLPPPRSCTDMRKAMPRDVAKKSIIPLNKPVRPEDLEFE